MAFKPLGSLQPFNPKVFTGTPGPKPGLTPISPTNQPLDQGAAPAGLPPAPYAQIKPLVKRTNLAKGGPLPPPTSMQPRSVTPSVTNPGKNSQLVGDVQPAGQMGGSTDTKQALDVAGMDQTQWQKLLAQFGVFA